MPSNVENELPSSPPTKLFIKKVPAPNEPFEILAHSLWFLELFGIVIGTKMTYEWKRDIRFIFTKMLTGFIWTQLLYTQLLYVYQHNSVRTLEIFAVYGMAVSAILKITCFEKFFKNIRALFDSSLKICQQSVGRRASRLKLRLQSNFTFFKFIASLAVVITIIYLYYPVKSFLIDGVLLPFVPMEIMFVDQSTLSGFLIANAILALSGFYAVFGTEYMGLSFVYIIANYALHVDVLEIDIEDLNELWNDTATSTVAYRHLFLKNVCRKHIDMRQYVNEVKNIFDEKMYRFFAFAYFSQILCMYQIRVNNWIPGYALAAGLFFEMIFYCIMGTKLTVENERFFYIITQSHWYTFDMYSQKLMVTLINSAINSEELWIGPIAPLSVYTATEIVKSIYTYYTVMTEVM